MPTPEDHEAMEFDYANIAGNAVADLQRKIAEQGLEPIMSTMRWVYDNEKNTAVLIVDCVHPSGRWGIDSYDGGE